MRINIHVLPRSSKNSVESISKNELKIRLTAPPTDGKANKALVRLLAEYYGTPKSKIKIIKGEKSKNKIIEIQG